MVDNSGNMPEAGAVKMLVNRTFIDAINEIRVVV
jgi:hypothetical protein